MFPTCLVVTNLRCFISDFFSQCGTDNSDSSFQASLYCSRVVLNADCQGWNKQLVGGSLYLIQLKLEWKTFVTFSSFTTLPLFSNIIRAPCKRAYKLHLSQQLVCAYGFVMLFILFRCSSPNAVNSLPDKPLPICPASFLLGWSPAVHPRYAAKIVGSNPTMIY